MNWKQHATDQQSWNEYLKPKYSENDLQRLKKKWFWDSFWYILWAGMIIGVGIIELIKRTQ